jgi:hypothetical protein
VFNPLDNHRWLLYINQNLSQLETFQRSLKLQIC